MYLFKYQSLENRLTQKDLVIVLVNLQKEVETPELKKGAVKAVQDLYDVIRHDVLSVNMRSVKTST